MIVARACRTVSRGIGKAFLRVRAGASASVELSDVAQIADALEDGDDLGV
jgi:hypothetical protein